ncbi:MAG: TIGR03086 family metal-binding protein, partial [Actinomycetota bacterium]
MTEAEAFVIADEALCNVVDQIADDQWSMALPAWFATGGSKEELDLRKVINYHTFDDAWVPDVLAGKTAAEVGDAYAGDLLGADPKQSFRAIAAKAVAAAKALDDLARTVHLSYG